MAQDVKFDRILDAKGMHCPQPILRTKKALKELSEGQVLKVETTDPGSKNDMASWARSTGNDLVRIDEDAGTFTFYIRKTA